MRNVFACLALVSTLFFASAFPASATPHCRQCPYDCSDLSLGRRDCSEMRPAGGLCCVDLTEYGLQLAREIERNQGSRPSNNNNNNGYNNRGGDRCPPGFSPSERKCSQQERRNGCRDVRTPSGLGCVSR
jgi:hypothetical protein